MSLDNQPEKRWEGVFRGSILSTAIAKHISYVGFGDQRAQGIIAINSLLVPIALSGVRGDTYRIAGLICVATSVLTIICAIASLFPKCYDRSRHRHTDLLHFSRIARMSEEEFLEEMRKTVEGVGTLTMAAARDIYHLSTEVLAPKFRFLRMSYAVFVIGNTIAIAAAIAAMPG